MPTIEYVSGHMLTTLTIRQAAEILHASGWPGSERRLREGIKQGVYPFGVCIQMAQDEFEIYKAQLERWISERLCEVRVPYVPRVPTGEEATTGWYDAYIVTE